MSKIYCTCAVFPTYKIFAYWPSGLFRSIMNRQYPRTFGFPCPYDLVLLTICIYILNIDYYLPWLFFWIISLPFFVFLLKIGQRKSFDIFFWVSVLSVYVLCLFICDLVPPSSVSCLSKVAKFSLTNWRVLRFSTRALRGNEESWKCINDDIPHNNLTEDFI